LAKGLNHGKRIIQNSSENIEIALQEGKEIYPE